MSDEVSLWFWWRIIALFDREKIDHGRGEGTDAEGSDPC